MNREGFERFLVVKKGLQPITIDGYLGTARRFTSVVGQYPTIEQSEKYIQVMYQSTYSYSYKINTALGIEQYMDFIGNPIRFGRQKKPKTIIKNTLTEAEVTKFIFSCKNLREKAIITLLAYSGIRNGELCNLKVKDFDAGTNSVHILKGKGLKDGVSMVSADCTRIIIDYLREYSRSPEQYMFTTLKHSHQYHGRDLQKLVRVIGRRMNLGRRVYPHLFRHSLTVNMLLRGANIITLQRQLRHAWTETTLLYLNSIVFAQMNQYDKTIPSYL